MRFPEFVNDGEWEEKALGKCLLKHPDYGVNAAAVPFSENLPTYLRITDISVDGYYLNNEKVSVNIDAISNNYLEDGDIVLARTGASVGKSYKYRKEDGALVFAGFLIRVKPDEKKLNSDLLFHFLSTEKYWNWVSVTSARSGQPGINGNEYANLPIPIPSTLNEQQKIADCLSSVDSLILAQSQKVELLKEHKKALMQQLFPQDGEEVPKLRFPEFKNAPKWEEKTLGSFCSITTGKLDANAMVENGQYRFYTCAKNYYYINNYAFDTEALLVSGNGANVGYIHYYKGKFNAYQRTYILDKFNKNIIFIKYYLEQNLHKRISTEKKEGNTPYIVMSTLTDMVILFPNKKEEQQKIANCLSSLDEQISRQTTKLQTLKEHKKALMQQLFPNSEIGR